MRKILFIPLMMVSILFFSCEKAGVQESAVLQNNKSVVDPGTILFGTCDGWYIASFSKERADMTSAFSSFRMVFCADKTMVIANDVFSVTGSWEVISEEEVPVKLSINLNKPVEALLNPAEFTFLNEVSGKWDIVQYNLNMLQLQNRDAFKTMLIQRGALQ